MFKLLLEILLLGHVIGDFYVQTEKMAEKKKTELKWVGVHSLCYFAAILLVGLPLMGKAFLGILVMLSVLHGLIDVGKFFYATRMRAANRWNLVVDRNVFLIDQLSHFLCIGMAAYWGTLYLKLQEWKGMKMLFLTMEVKKETILTWILMLLLIHKPANIMIQKLLTIYRPVGQNETTEEGVVQTDRNTGRFIGTVERIIMLIFLTLQQYSAIGLVLTAKSIARYDKITKERDFAEYYLLGTLISTLSVIVVAQLG